MRRPLPLPRAPSSRPNRPASLRGRQAALRRAGSGPGAPHDEAGLPRRGATGSRGAAAESPSRCTAHRRARRRTTPRASGPPWSHRARPARSRRRAQVGSVGSHPLSEHRDGQLRGLVLDEESSLAKGRRPLRNSRDHAKSAGDERARRGRDTFRGEPRGQVLRAAFGLPGGERRRRRLVPGGEQGARALPAEPRHHPTGPPDGMRVRERQPLDVTAIGIRRKERVAVAGDRPEHAVDETGRLRAPGVLDEGHGGVDGGEVRDAIEEQQRVGADAKRRENGRLDRAGIPRGDACYGVVERAPPPQDPENDLVEQRQIARVVVGAGTRFEEGGRIRPRVLDAPQDRESVTPRVAAAQVVPRAGGAGR